MPNREGLHNLLDFKCMLLQRETEAGDKDTLVQGKGLRKLKSVKDC